MQSHDFRFSVLVKPDEEVAGQWIAHCLDLDLVSQGNSLQHAVEMICDAIAIVLLEDAHAGFNDMQRKAPHHFWQELQRLALLGNPASIMCLDQAKIAAAIVYLHGRPSAGISSAQSLESTAILSVPKFLPG